MIAVADVADRSGMEAALRLAQAQWGLIAGVVHAAGIPDGSLMAECSRNDVASGLAAKVHGTDVLLELLGGQPLDFVLLCSSINAVNGFAGAAVYTAANAYLDAVAQSARRPMGWHVVSLAWDVWRTVGMATYETRQTDARQAHVAAGIGSEDGVQAFARAWASGEARFVVSPFDVERAQQLRHRLRASTRGSAALSSLEPRQSVPEPRTSSSILTDPEGEVESRLAKVWEDLLGVSPIGVQDNFFELGGHSLLATRVLARIDSFFGVRLPLRAIFEAPTIRQLGAMIVERRADTTSDAVAVAAGEREEFEL
jgi:acyl carrier protein